MSYSIKVNDAYLHTVSNSLRSIKLLRSNVKDLFKVLADGKQYINNGNDETNDQDINYLTNLQNLMTNVNNQVRSLESSVSALASSTVNSSTTLGNATLLGLDPYPDKTLLYTSMIMSYRWCDKLLDSTSHAFSILNSSHLKRTIWSGVNISRNRPTQPKKALNTGYNIPSQKVDEFINILSRQINLKIEFERPYGDPTILKINLDKVLRAIILLRGYIIEWVNVKAFHEDFLNNDEKLDIWTESRYEVFQKITDHANSAMLHYSAPLHSDVALKSFIIWFKNYSTLFTRPCRKCGTKLKNNFPPTWRDHKTYEAFHDVCKP